MFHSELTEVKRILIEIFKTVIRTAREVTQAIFVRLVQLVTCVSVYLPLLILTFSFLVFHIFGIFCYSCVCFCVTDSHSILQSVCEGLVLLE